MALTRKPLAEDSPEREEYILSQIPYFLDVGGNIPFSTFIKENGLRCPQPHVKLEDRLYLCEQPLGLSQIIHWCTREEKLINALKFKSLSTHQIVNVDIRWFIKWEHDKDNNIWYANGTVNKHLRACLKNAVPYLTLRELIMEAVRYIGKDHIYFTCPNLKLPFLWDCNFAEYVNHSQR